MLLVAFAVVGVEENFGGELLSHFRISVVEWNVQIGGGSVESADLVNFVFQVNGFRHGSESSTDPFPVNSVLNLVSGFKGDFYVWFALCLRKKKTQTQNESINVRIIIYL